MKCKLFTHNDLDGVACAILGKLAYKDIDIDYCGYYNVNEKVKEFIESGEYNNYSQIYITDISVNEEVAEMIDSLSNNNFKLLDHHQTALNLNKYWWCNVVIDDNIEKVSGASLFYKELSVDNIFANELLENEDIKRYDDLLAFIEMVKRYDTWLWETKYQDIMPKKLNDLFFIYGREKFIERVLEQFKLESEFSFTKTDELLLELQEEKVKKYIDTKEKKMIIKEIQGLNAGVVFAEQHISELGNELAKRNPELDFIVIISDGTISYRGIKENIDLGELVKKLFGGGGHKKAAGSQIDRNKQLDYINSLFARQ